MLIRAQQMDQFSKAMSSAFEDEMVHTAKERYPGKSGGLTDEELRGIVRSGIGRAKQYGIELRHDVERFVDLMFRFRVFDFEQDPPTAWTLEILADESSTPGMKLDQVEGRGALFGLLEEERS